MCSLGLLCNSICVEYPNLVVERIGRVHCEFALAVHLIAQNRKNPSTPATLYVRVLKLSCLVCFVSLDPMICRAHFPNKEFPQEGVLSVEMPFLKGAFSEQILNMFCESLEVIFVTQWPKNNISI